MTAPNIECVGNDYRVSWPEDGLQADITRVHDTRNGVQAEVKFTDVNGPDKRFIAQRQVNLATGAPGFVRDLEKLGLEGDVNWAKAVEELGYLVKERHRKGEPSIDLRDYEPQPRRWILEPYLEASGSTVLFGPGGSLKSFLALVMAVSMAAGTNRLGNARIARGPVLYLDFETEVDEHSRRFQAIVHGMGLESRPYVAYKRVRSALHTVIDGIAGEIAERNYVAVVIDSLGKARGGEPESAEVTLRMFNAIDQMRVPALCIDHLSKEAMTRKSGHLTPFGSIYTENSARSTWSVNAADGTVAGEKLLALVTRKSNNGPLRERREYRLVFGLNSEGQDSLEISPHDVAHVPEFEHSLTRPERIKRRLARGPLTSLDLASELDELVTSVRPALTRMKEKGHAVLLDDGTWELRVEPGPEW